MRIDRVERAFVEVECACVEISCCSSVGYCQQFKTGKALLNSAPRNVTAVGDTGVVDLRPGTPAVQALPDPLINRHAVGIGRHEPDVVFVAPWNDGNFRAEDWASLAISGRKWRACRIA